GHGRRPERPVPASGAAGEDRPDRVPGDGQGITATANPPGCPGRASGRGAAGPVWPAPGELSRQLLSSQTHEPQPRPRLLIPPDRWILACAPPWPGSAGAPISPWRALELLRIVPVRQFGVQKPLKGPTVVERPDPPRTKTVQTVQTVQ